MTAVPPGAAAGSSPSAIATATASANTNIALIKYWGKVDEAQAIPATSSLSLTLAGTRTTTTVSFDGGAGAADSVTINGSCPTGTELARVSRFLDLVRSRSGVATPATVISRASVPLAAGLASSAAGFAALAAAASRAAGMNLDDRALSRLARRGSGSATRSVFGGLVLWNAGHDDASSYAEPVACEMDLAMVVVVLSQRYKPISSTLAMRATMASSPLFPAWDNIRGLIPREPIHTQTIDQHCLQVTQNCAAHHVAAARPDLLYLAALFHDIGKGQGVPHAELGATLVAAMAATLRLNHHDASVVTTLVRHHTLIPNLVAHRDVESDDAVTELLDAVGYDLLTVELMHVLVQADALATGTWTPTLQVGAAILCDRARARLTGSQPRPPRLDFSRDFTSRAGLPLDLIPGPEANNATVRWVGHYLRESIRVLALIAAKGWNINSAEFVVEPDYTWARFTVYNTLGTGFDQAEFAQAYKSGVYSALPDTTPTIAATTATFWFGNILEIRTTDRQAALGTLMEVLPELHWLTMSNPGATMIVQCSLRPGFDRAAVERDVTRVLTTS